MALRPQGVHLYTTVDVSVPNKLPVSTKMEKQKSL